MSTSKYPPSTGYSNADIPSHSTTAQNTGTVHPQGTSTDNKSSGGFGHSVKSAAAGVHGLGETLRGGACAAVDRAMDDPEGVRKNEAILREGEQEVDTGDFSSQTKEKEGFHHGRKRSDI